jgi:GH18 family chitinase
VTGPTAAFPFSQQPGVVDFKELATAGKLTPATTFYDYETQSSWVYDGTNFWTVETPQSLTAKWQYIQNKGLGGIMMYSLEADSSTNTLFNAAAG